MTYDLSCDPCRVAPGSVQMLGSWCQRVDSLAWASLGSQVQTAPGTQVPQAGNLPSALGSRGEWRRDPGLVYMALSLIPTKPQLLSKGDVSSRCHSAGPHGEPSPGRNGEEKPQATEGEQTARSPVSTVPKGPKGRHVCAHWVCVVCRRGHTGECVYGRPGEAGSRGFPPRPAEVLSPGEGVLTVPRNCLIVFITCPTPTPDK